MKQLYIKILTMCFIATNACAYNAQDSGGKDKQSNESTPIAHNSVAVAYEPSSNDCVIVKSSYVDNCVLNVIKCTDGSTHYDDYCYGPLYVPVWKWIPDPPFKQNEKTNINVEN